MLTRGQVLLLWVIAISIVLLGLIISSEMWCSKRYEQVLLSLRDDMVYDHLEHILRVSLEDLRDEGNRGDNNVCDGRWHQLWVWDGNGFRFTSVVMSRNLEDYLNWYISHSFSFFRRGYAIGLWYRVEGGCGGGLRPLLMEGLAIVANPNSVLRRHPYLYLFRKYLLSSNNAPSILTLVSGGLWGYCVGNNLGYNSLGNGGGLTPLVRCYRRPIHLCR